MTRYLAIALLVAACSDHPVSPPPPAPTTVVASTGVPGVIHVGWVHSGSIDEFRIERRVAAAGITASFAQIAIAASDLRAYADNSVAQGTRYEYRVRACAASSCSDYSASAFAVAAVSGRVTTDRADDVSGSQVRVMYVLPSDGADRLLDVNGTLARSVSSFRNWFTGRSGGLSFRFDTHQGGLDIGFFRMSKTDAQMKTHDPAIVLEIERQLQDAGLRVPNKLYIVYYDGGSSYACGGAAWPPNVLGQTAAMYLKGTPGGGSCGLQQFAPAPTSPPGYWEYAMLHDLVHTLGIVSRQAPNHTQNYPAHVPEGNDLMYTGPGPWLISQNLVLDVHGDDYFGASVAAGLPTLNGSPYVITPVPGAAATRAPSSGELTPFAARALATALSTLPMHPPFEQR